MATETSKAAPRRAQMDLFQRAFAGHGLDIGAGPDLYRWIKLVKPGGYLVFSVPDWELYEGCRWPSLHNPDHKSAWGMGPIRQNLSRVRVPYFDIFDFLGQFDVHVLLVQQVDTRYDYRHFGTTLDQTLSCNAEAFIEVVLWKRDHFFPS